jgi:hypothetical protein
LVLGRVDTPHATNEKNDRCRKRERDTVKDQVRWRKPERYVRPAPPELQRVQRIVGATTRRAIGRVILSVPPEFIQFLGFTLCGRRQSFYLLVTFRDLALELVLRERRLSDFAGRCCGAPLELLNAPFGDIELLISPSYLCYPGFESRKDRRRSVRRFSLIVAFRFLPDGAEPHCLFVCSRCQFLYFALSRLGQPS